MESELADSKHELLKIQEMLEMAEKVTETVLHFSYYKQTSILIHYYSCSCQQMP